LGALLAASPNQPDRLAQTVERVRDWEAIFALAERHGVETLLSREMEKAGVALPEPFQRDGGPRRLAERLWSGSACGGSGRNRRGL
jgi:hypothetical protein